MTQTVREVVNAIGGRRAVAEMLGITPEAVDNAMRRGIMPSTWHIKVVRIAKRKGVKIAPEMLEVRRA